MRNALWIGGGITGMGEIPLLGVKEKGIAKVIRNLFRNSEQGVFYDPFDMSTLYQDAAGTVPVTAAGQPVGLMLDKSKGLVIGAEILQNGVFDTTSNWTLTSGISISGGKLNVVASVGGSATQILGSYKPVGWYEIRVKVDVITSSDVTARLLSTSSTIVGSGTYKNTAGEHIWKVLATAPFDRVVIQCGGGAGLTATIDSISVKELAGNHAYQTVSASRPVLRKNDTTGAYYLEFDGVDDFLQTNNIDFTSTDKVSVFAGVRKLIDAGFQIVAELSANAETNFGSFALTTSRLYSGQRTSFNVVMNKSSSYYFPYVAPYSAVLTDKLDSSTFSADNSSNLRVNGAAGLNKTINPSPIWTGNFGNYPLYIGRRAGVSNPFNGHLYSLIIMGRLASDTETTVLEKAIAKRVGVTL